MQQTLFHSKFSLNKKKHDALGYYTRDSSDRKKVK